MLRLALLLFVLHCLDHRSIPFGPVGSLWGGAVVNRGYPRVSWVDLGVAAVILYTAMILRLVAGNIAQQSISDLSLLCSITLGISQLCHLGNHLARVLQQCLALS